MDRDRNQQRDREATETRLLDAAVEVFARRGFEAATVLEIAQAAETNASLINRYFGSKRGLLLAATMRLLDEKSFDPLPYQPMECLADEIYHYLHHRLAEDLAKQDIIRLTVSRVAIDDEFRKATLANFRTEADQNFVERIARLQELGEVSADTNVEMLFQTITRFVFTANFFDAIIRGERADELDDSFSEFSLMVANGVARQR